MDIGEQAQPTADKQEKPIAPFSAEGTITFGRDEGNDVVLLDDWISPKHGRVQRSPQYTLEDLDSSNGIHVAGKRLTGSMSIKAGDVFTIGRHRFKLEDSGVFRSPQLSDPSIEAYDMTVVVDNPGRWRRRGKLKPVLDDVSFVVRPATLLGVVGPSGSGKSTLLRTITGTLEPTQGRLVFQKQDLYREGVSRRGIGMVPQEDILHKQLTVNQGLWFAAALRCAREMNGHQRAYKVEEVLDLLGLKDRRSMRIARLSGGQRKRVSVAMELLTKPPLLCLDEPTSGLDPALDHDVMAALRDLASGDNTVIIATHTPMHLDACDAVLVMCMGGRMAYFGPPGEELFDFFETGQNRYADVFSKISDEPEQWAQKYRNSEVYSRYVGEDQLALLTKESEDRKARLARQRAAQAEAVRAEEAAAAATGNSAPRRRRIKPAATTEEPKPRKQHVAPKDRPPTPVWQWLVLCLRMLSVIVSDRKYALLSVGLPLVLAGLSHLIPGSKGLSPDPAGYSLEANRLLIVLITGAALMGVAAPIREIVSEADIHRRERASGLSATAYLLSKVAVFLVIDCLQVFLFVGLAMVGRGAPRQALVLPDPTLEVMVAVALVAISSTALGLLASAMVRTVEQTTPLLIISVVAQLILSGALFPITGHRPLEIAAWLDPSRWGYAAAAATTDMKNFPFVDPLWHHDAPNWWMSILWLGVQIVAMLGLARWALARYKPGH